MVKIKRLKASYWIARAHQCLLKKKGRAEIRAIKILLAGSLEFLKMPLLQLTMFSVRTLSGEKRAKHPKTHSRQQVEGMYVKEGLGVISLIFILWKHLNLDGASIRILDAEQLQNSWLHTSAVVTLKHYTVNEEERKKRERLRREVNNGFCVTKWRVPKFPRFLLFPVMSIKLLF
jgi:hypothetical protein